jgi:hypothetical protein
MEELRVTTNYVNQVEQPHNLNSVRRGELSSAGRRRVIWSGTDVSEEPNKADRITFDNTVNFIASVTRNLYISALRFWAIFNIMDKYGVTSDDELSCGQTKKSEGVEVYAGQNHLHMRHQ